MIVRYGRTVTDGQKNHFEINEIKILKLQVITFLLHFYFYFYFTNTIS